MWFLNNLPSTCLTEITQDILFKIYSNNEALTPNPRSPLEDYSLHLVDLRGGKLCDTRHFKVDKIYLSHNQGIDLLLNIEVTRIKVFNK